MSVIQKALRSFGYAFEGIVFLFRYEHNAIIHLTIALNVVIVGFFLELSPAEWSLIVIQIGLVMMAEAFNTAVEKLADRVTPDIDPAIKQVKDLSAGAVLIAAATAAIVGVLIMAPKLADLIW